MKIQIWSDFSCPFCYLGKTRLEKAIAQSGFQDSVVLEYQSFQLNPNAPKQTTLTAAEAFVKEKGVSLKEAQEMFAYVGQQFQAEAIEVKMDEIKMTSTFDAHRVAKYAKEMGKDSEYTALMMKAYFEEGKNIADHQVIGAIAKQVGLDKDEVQAILSSNRYAQQVTDEINQAQSLGVRGVPFFVINGKYAISGAQPIAIFEQALNQVHQEEQPLQSLADDRNLCADGTCTIK